MKTISFLCSRAGIAALALTAAFVGCSSDSGITAPDAAGQFSAVVTDGSQLSLHGAAGLISLPATGSDSTSAPSSALLILQDQKTSAQMGFQWIGTALPPAGNYAVGSGDLDVAVAFQDSTGAIFDGIGGSVTIAPASNGHVSGTFSVTAESADSTAHTASISGSFNAPVVVQ